ncbi:MAG TPA: hypothetical protein VFS30_18060 [Dehalococcoidia bacterium]|nr:hypothetical protein [Dehalococcoidia bacterium]
MSDAATGLLAVWMDLPAEQEEDFNRWYNEEHLIDRMACPGFLRVRRFVSVNGGPKYVALYDLADGAMTSPEYTKARQNPTEWTKKVSAGLTTNIRNEYELAKQVGESPATPPPYLLMVCLESDDEHDAEVIEWYDNEHLAALQSVPGCHSAKRYRATDLTPGFPKNLAIYELDAPEVRTSDAWHKAADTEWTLRMRTHFLPNRVNTMGQLIKVIEGQPA